MTLRQLAVQVDERLAELYDARFWHAQNAADAKDLIWRSSTQTREEFRASRWAKPTYGPWSGTFEEALAEVEAGSPNDRYGYARTRIGEYRAAIAALAQIKIETTELDAVWREEGRWNRAFLVINSNGHVHNGMDCSTCYPSTRYEWLTAYSAADEDEIVKAAGEMACTVCYPTAPSDYLNRPSDLISKTRQEKEAAAAVRAAEKAEREAKKRAKAPTATGEELRIPSDWTPGRFETIATEATARREWNSDEDSIRWMRQCGRLDKADVKAERQRLIEEALAGKYGISPAEMRDQLLAKFAKRRR